MRVVVQRVSHGRVSVEGRTLAEIGVGLVILLGIGPQDGEEQAQYLAEKIANLRIFEDASLQQPIYRVGKEGIAVYRTESHSPHL